MQIQPTAIKTPSPTTTSPREPTKMKMQSPETAPQPKQPKQPSKTITYRTQNIPYTSNTDRNTSMRMHSRINLEPKPISQRIIKIDQLSGQPGNKNVYSTTHSNDNPNNQISPHNQQKHPNENNRKEKVPAGTCETSNRPLTNLRNGTTHDNHNIPTNNQQNNRNLITPS